MSYKIIFWAILLLPVLGSAKAAAPDTATLPLTNVSVIANSVSGFSILINFRPALDSMIIDDDYFHDKKTEKPQFRVTYQGVKSKGSCIQAHAYASPGGFGVIVSDFTEKEIRQFLAKDISIGVECSRDFIVRYYSKAITHPAESDYHYYSVKATDLNNLIVNNISISDSDRSNYVTAVNTFYYFENKVDVGVAPAANGEATSYVLSASVRNKFAPAKLMSCNAGTGTNNNMPQLFWSLSARVSTIATDSLNYIDFSPVNLTWSSKNFARQLNLKLANESDQTFTNKRATIDASYRCIIPNLVNLTTQQDDRLRLKPIINIGAKGYYDYSNNTTAFTSAQGYGKIYYYIPVYNHYSLIINGTAFYDMSTERNPGHKLATNYSVVVASELPSTGFKAIIKYENGKSDIDNKTGSTVVIGLLMDFLKDHPNLARTANAVQNGLK